MFYSDVLLSKTGPLARVWLASNLDRRLTKRDCLQSNLEDSIDLIVDETAAPMALRLSGQLLLGVVKIYKRKAGYLLEDCNEALLKIKLVRFSHMIAFLFLDRVVSVSRKQELGLGELSTKRGQC